MGQLQFLANENPCPGGGCWYQAEMTTGAVFLLVHKLKLILSNLGNGCNVNGAIFNIVTRFWREGGQRMSGDEHRLLNTRRKRCYSGALIVYSVRSISIGRNGTDDKFTFSLPRRGSLLTIMVRAIHDLIDS